MENQKSNKGVYIAAIVVLLLLNGVLGYLLYVNNSEKKDLEVAKQELDNQYQGVLTELEARKAELEQYKGKNAELDSIIAARQAEIDKYKGEIEGLLRKGKITASELSKARQLIEKLKAENKELQGKVEELTKANEMLTQENQQLGKSLEEEKKTKEAIAQEKENLSKKVALGSLLKLNNLKVTGVNIKSNGKEDETTKLKKVDKLKISFETGENKIAEKGSLKLYVRVINPKGETIAVRDQGSGTLKLADSGDDVQYSRVADVDYQQTNKKVTVDWSSNINLEGTYKVEIYQSGYLIGKGEVKLK
jgi:predicted RNase H-like nuclease (RuvC/YqgF family)